MSEYGASRVREKLVWQHSVPPLLAAYDAIFQRIGSRTAPMHDDRRETGHKELGDSKELGVANDGGR
jgi:hypothetical protein